MTYAGNVLAIVSGLIAGSLELFTGGNVSHVIWPFAAASWAAMGMIK